MRRREKVISLSTEVIGEGDGVVWESSRDVVGWSDECWWCGAVWILGSVVNGQRGFMECV